MKTEYTGIRRSAASVGITSLVLIFVMLCLLTFSVLSLVSARADLRLSQRSAARTSAYYDAENRASDILLSVIENTEACLAEAGGSEAAFCAEIRERLDGQDGILFTDEHTLCYEVPLESEQLLCVSLELSFNPYEDGCHYRILEWRTESVHEWETDEPLPLLDQETLSDMLLED